MATVFSSDHALIVKEGRSYEAGLWTRTLAAKTNDPRDAPINRIFDNADDAFGWVIKGLMTEKSLKGELEKARQAQKANYENAISDSFDENNKKKHWYWR
jgi:hypothetical protein